MQQIHYNIFSGVSLHKSQIRIDIDISILLTQYTAYVAVNNILIPIKIYP